MIRTATQWPPINESASARQGKITHLLSIILDECQSLNDWDFNFVTDMKRLINRRTGIEPATALSEKQARKLRSIIFKRHRDYKHAVPSLPAGVKFEDEVRRLLKSQPNPNEARNQSIQKAKDLLGQYLDAYAERNEWWDGEQKIGRTKYKGIEGDYITFEVEMIVSEGGNYTSTYEVNVDTNEVESKGGNYTY
jgi:hypothetical protein